TRNEENEYMLIFEWYWYSSRCTECLGEKRNGWIHFCQRCQTEFFRSNFTNWSSGNADIDEIIRTSQLDAKKPEVVVEWIPFSEFGLMKKIDQGGSSSIYKATRQHPSSFDDSYITSCALKSYHT